MEGMGKTFDGAMRRMPDAVLVAIGLAIIAALTAFKLTAGQSVTLIDFLFVPVVWVGWFAQRRWCGYLVALAAAIDSLVVQMVAETHATFAAASASAGARLALYLLVLGLLGMMRHERAAHRLAATVDAMTGAVNGRVFREIAATEVLRSQRYQHELSLAFLDLDDFKAVNDQLGHPEGDHVLAEVGHVLRTMVRNIDTVARLGGDEFAILMPETQAQAAAAVIRRVREHLARLRTSDGRGVACSVGLVTFDRPPGRLDELMDAGDELMYRAKQLGKDRVEQAERSGSHAQSPAFAGAQNSPSAWASLNQV
jgi:diguanylate cyclase (GGDEF)-like protein